MAQTTFPSLLRPLRVFGFDELEPLILAALVSEDPILLIGQAGTGKTFLLNSISEAMNLEHRHYNASLISFDDLIGYPYPAADGQSVSFLPTPATIWGAQSVLVDELSRCKPETQNKFFALIHEKKMQGQALDSLVYRWAAMNPFALLTNEQEDAYSGSQPLDPALADRFAFVLEVPDWPALTQTDQEAVIHPEGEALLSNDNGHLLRFVQRVKPVFAARIRQPLPEVVRYCRHAAGLMSEAGLRISPRRARLLARNLTALLSVAEALDLPLELSDRKALYKSCLRWSLPHRAYREIVPDHTIDSVHADACRLTFSSDPKEVWIAEFLHTQNLSKKISLLFDASIDRDTRSLALVQFLGRDTLERRAILAFSTYPALEQAELLTEDALESLARAALPVMQVSGKMEWREALSRQGTNHPSLARCTQFLATLPATFRNRIDRATNLFLYLITQGQDIPQPQELEAQLNSCFEWVAASSILRQ